jgi:GNAT superfamily N-acetyltransferase
MLEKRMQIQTMSSSGDIGQCFDTFLELRPHINVKADFVNQVVLQQLEGYQINAVLEDGTVAACIGYRILTTLAWGKILYIDDLIAKNQYRGKGYGSMLLKHTVNVARNLGCKQVHLDTGYTRHAAHRMYLQHGFELNCHHLALKVE